MLQSWAFHCERPRCVTLIYFFMCQFWGSVYSICNRVRSLKPFGLKDHEPELLISIFHIFLTTFPVLGMFQSWAFHWERPLLRPTLPFRTLQYSFRWFAITSKLSCGLFIYFLFLLFPRFVLYFFFFSSFFLYLICPVVENVLWLLFLITVRHKPPCRHGIDC